MLQPSAALSLWSVTVKVPPEVAFTCLLIRFVLVEKSLEYREKTLTIITSEKNLSCTIWARAVPNKYQAESGKEAAEGRTGVGRGGSLRFKERASPRHKSAR